MKYEIVLNYINHPLLVYDGSETNKIIYRPEKGKEYKQCSFDLWKSAQGYWKESMSEEEFKQLDQMFKFPRKISLGEELVFSHVKDGPVLIARNQIDQATCNFIVYYTLFEKQPSRYQCFVFAVLKIIGDEMPS